jgi:[protein-PII] uridylyltransferase
MLTSTEARQLRQKERAFKDIRIRLHILTDRREDRLVFDIQTRSPRPSASRPPIPAAPANT